MRASTSTLIAVLFCTIASTFLVFADGTSALSDWRRVRTATAADTVRFTLALRLSNAHVITDTLAAVSDPDSKSYGAYLTLEQLAERVHGAPDAVSGTRAALSAAGIDADAECKTTLDQGWLVCAVHADRASALFQNATFEVLEHTRTAARTVRALNLDVASTVPRSLAPHVDFVSGHAGMPSADKWLNVRSIHTSSSRSSVKAVGGGITPDVIDKTYGMNGYTSSARNNSQAVTGFLKQYFDPKDLAAFQKQFGLPDHPISRVVGTNKPTNEGIEAALDVQYIGAAGRGVSTWFVSTSTLANGGQEDFLSWVIGMLNTSDAPLVHSISYGDVEASIDESYRARLDTELARFGVTGRTVLVAAGDSGVSCHKFKFWPDWPTSSPHVLSVGGSEQESPDEPEHVWPDGGGGFANRAAMPSWQKTAVETYLASPVCPSHHLFNASGRAYPDVAAFASDVVIVVGGRQTGVAGTSCATPIFAGVVSQLNDVRLAAGKPPLGFVNPLIYKKLGPQTGAFNDITKGSNPDGVCKGFEATKGWDPASGWGSPVFSELKKLVLAQ